MPFYKGVLVDLKIIEDGKVFYLKGQAFSSSYLLDIKKKRRSYQRTENNYENLLSEVLSEYSNASFLDTLSNQKEVGQFLTQYDETDWQFITRLATHFLSVPISTDQYDEIKFYFGMPKISKVEYLDNPKYQIKWKKAEFHNMRDNSHTNILEQDFIEYKVDSPKILTLGAKVSFLGKILYIVSLERTMINDVIVNTYYLRGSKGIQKLKTYNPFLIGNSLVGTVKSVKTDKVLIQLDIDNVNQAYYWFTYSTGYTSDDNIGWYMMPEVGEKVRLYYPTEDEKDAVAMSTIRTEENDQLNPAIKTLSNKHGKMITLEPDRITITGNGVEIILKDNSEINITSIGNVNVTAEGNITMNGNNILLDGGNSVVLSSQGNAVNVDSKISVSGSEIKMN